MPHQIRTYLLIERASQAGHDREPIFFLFLPNSDTKHGIT